MKVQCENDSLRSTTNYKCRKSIIRKTKNREKTKNSTSDALTKAPPSDSLNKQLDTHSEDYVLTADVKEPQR